MLIGIGILLFGLFIWGVGWTIHKDDFDDIRGGTHAFGVVVALLGLAISVVSGAVTYTSSGMNAAKLEAFYVSNLSAYTATVDNTTIYLSEDEITGHLIEGSIEKVGLGVEVANRLKEVREAVTEYNEALAKHRFQEDSWLYHPWVEAPKNLFPVVLR